MIRTSAPTIRISRSLRSRSGFTLIEILIVIALIALVMSVAVPNLGLAMKMNITNSSRDIATTIRTAYDEAMLKGDLYRIVLNLDTNEYWVEVGERTYLARTAEQEEILKRKTEHMTEAEKQKHSDAFSIATNVTKNKKSLPTGVVFKDVLTTRSKNPQTKGLAFTHVYPHGFVERMIIHLKDKFDRESTLIVNSISGKSLVVERYVKDVP